MGLRADSVRPQRVSVSARTDSRRAKSARNPMTVHVKFGNDCANAQPGLSQWTAAFRPSCFWTSFRTNISFQSGHSSIDSVLASFWHSIPCRWMTGGVSEYRSERVSELSCKDEICVEPGRCKHFCRTIYEYVQYSTKVFGALDPLSFYCDIS